MKIYRFSASKRRRLAPHLLRFFIAIQFSLGIVNAAEIFDKAEAFEMFGTPLGAWNSNVLAIQNAGLGMAQGEAESGLQLATLTPSGYLIVGPYYRTESGPEFLNVTIGFPPEQAEFIELQALSGAMDRAAEQLAPEFSFTYAIERIEDGLAVFVTIDDL